MPKSNPAHPESRSSATGMRESNCLARPEDQHAPFWLEDLRIPKCFPDRKHTRLFSKISCQEEPCSYRDKFPPLPKSCSKPPARQPQGRGVCRAFPPLPTSARVRQMFLACRMNGGLTCFGQDGHVQASLKAETPTLISPSSTHMKGGKATAAFCFHSELKTNHYTLSK